jgi:hypothetical protein
MLVLIIISSKSPNSILYDCIEQLYKIQIQDSTNYKICVIDSDSSDVTYYEKIKKDFSDVELCFAKNKNYEYGAWKYAYTKYPSYDTYFCIQDSITIQKKLDLSLIDNNTAYTIHHNSGYNSHLEVKQRGIENLKNSEIKDDFISDILEIINDNFTLAQHCSFIVNNYLMKDIFDTLTIPPIDKVSSCFYERNFGLYFIIKNIYTFDISSFIKKINGRRL